MDELSKDTERPIECVLAEEYSLVDKTKAQNDGWILVNISYNHRTPRLSWTKLWHEIRGSRCSSKDNRFLYWRSIIKKRRKKLVLESRRKKNDFPITIFLNSVCIFVKKKIFSIHFQSIKGMEFCFQTFKLEFEWKCTSSSPFSSSSSTPLLRLCPPLFTTSILPTITTTLLTRHICRHRLLSLPRP